jgi:hypothetical protein
VIKEKSGKCRETFYRIGEDEKFGDGYSSDIYLPPEK